MDPLQIRENEIFEALKKLKEFRFVIIGGYAANAYALPRFSADCDIVISNKTGLKAIEKELIAMGYKKQETAKISSQADFARYEKDIVDNFNVSFDVLIGSVIDRQTKVSISADWIFEHSGMRTLRGKTITEKLELRIIDIDALFVMKMISCRATGIRDMFMLAPMIKDKKWVREEVSSKYDFGDRFEKVNKAISSSSFRNGLQGVYGIIDESAFRKSKAAIRSFDG